MLKLPIIMKQFGLPRSGTNYTSYLLDKNYHVNIMEHKHGWKHGFYKDYTKNLIINVKNPYSWLVSSYNYYCKHHNHTFEVFLSSPFDYEGFASKTPIIHWNRMCNHWLRNNDHYYLIKYEDLYQDPQRICENIASMFGLVKRQEFTNIEKELLPGGEIGKQNFCSAYYDNKEYLNILSKEYLKAINSALDAELMAELGYDIYIITKNGSGVGGSNDTEFIESG